MVVKSLKVLKIVKWLNEMEIKNYTINDDLSVDVDGNVWLRNKSLIEIPVQFNRVEGVFDCSHNQLTSLEGCPREMSRRWFDCSHNQLTSLEGCPSEVGGNFFCSNTAVEFSEEYIREVCWVGGEVIV